MILIYLTLLELFVFLYLLVYYYFDCHLFLIPMILCCLLCVFLLSSSNFVSSLAFSSGSVDSSTFVIILGTLGVVFEVLLFLSDVLGLLSSGVFGSSGFVAGTSSFTNILNCVVNPSYVTFYYLYSCFIFVIS